MGDSRFPVLGAEIPPMLGRKAIMQRLWNDLTKATPSHLSVVGPRYAGKSVLLKALAARMRADGSPYCSVILWDLGHQTPGSDAEFMKILCRKLGEGIRDANAVYSEHLLTVDSSEYVEICEVLDALQVEGEKILMLWDGFDKPLRAGTLARNLWDNLLELCRKPSFRLVTSTRKELHQLIRDEKSVTSDFWGVFEGIVRVSAFDEADMEEILATLPDLNFQAGAKTELRNWSAGFPPFLLEILNQIIADTSQGQIDNQAVNQAAPKATEKLAGVITNMWDDCPAEAKDLCLLLVDRGDLPAGDVGKEAQRCLIEKGFARQSGNKLFASCRMLQEHIRGGARDSGSMARLFGAWDDYRANIRSLLERRLAQISRFDDRLYRNVESSISDLPGYPEDSLNNLTHIEDRALALIWQRELGSDKKLLPGIIAHWTTSPRDENNLIKEMMDKNSWVVPPDRTRQIRLLQLLTGSQLNFESKAKSTSKDTFALINAIHSYRNRSQHSDGQEMHVGVAVAAIMTCLELLACLDRESSL